jgi:hypothetical protein
MSSFSLPASDDEADDTSPRALSRPALLCCPAAGSHWFHLRVEAPSGGIAGLGVASASQDECVFARGDGAVSFDVVLLRAGGTLEAFLPGVLVSGGALAVASSPALSFSPRALFTGDAATRVAARAFPEVCRAAEGAGTVDEMTVVVGDAVVCVPASDWRRVVAGDPENASSRLLARSTIPVHVLYSGGPEAGADSHVEASTSLVDGAPHAACREPAQWTSARRGVLHGLERARAES